MEPLINRVAESDIDVLNLESLLDFDSIVEFDISPFLDKGIILRETDFRKQVNEFDWKQFDSKHVALMCSTDAIVPTWAFMLVATKLSDIAASLLHGRRDLLIQNLFRLKLDDFDWSIYNNRIVVIKGCGSDSVPEDAYLYATTKLTSVARKIMYGEPCSSVHLWRRKAVPDGTDKTNRVMKPILPRPTS